MALRAEARPGYIPHVKKVVNKCAHCKARFWRSSRGRPRIYCSQSCAQRAYEKRKLLAAIDAAPLRPRLHKDIDRVVLEATVLEILRKLGVTEFLFKLGWQAPRKFRPTLAFNNPHATAPRRKPNLKVVKPPSDRD